MRHLFGLSPADFAMEKVGTSLQLVPGAIGTVWDSLAGGTQITDLTDLNGEVITSVTADTDARIAFYGPDDGTSSLYVDFGWNMRYLMSASDLGDTVEGLKESKLDLVGGAMLGPLAMDAGATATDLSVSGLLTSGGFRADHIPPINRRPMWADGDIVTTFQAGHDWLVGTGIGSASGNAGDTSDFIKGTQSVKVTTAANGEQSQIRKTGMPAFDLTDKAIRLVLKVDDVTNLDRIRVYVGTSNFANYFYWDVHVHSTSTTQNWVSSGEWVTLTFGWASVTTGSGAYSLSPKGAPSTTTGFTDMEVVVMDNAVEAVTYHVQSIEIIDATSATFPNGVVSITFDDSYSLVYDNARPLLDAKGYRGTCYHIAELVDSGPDYMTMAQIRNLQDYAGWEQGGHAYLESSHASSMTGLTAAQADTDMALMRNWLVSNGLTGDTYAWPHGEYQATSDGIYLESIASRYFSAARSITASPEHYSPPMPYRLRTQTGINDGVGLGGITVSAMDKAGGLLDRCQTSGSWLILCLHRVVTGTPADSGQISTTGLATLLDAIESREIKVLPVGDVLRYYS